RRLLPRIAARPDQLDHLVHALGHGDVLLAASIARVRGREQPAATRLKFPPGPAEQQRRLPGGRTWGRATNAMDGGDGAVEVGRDAGEDAALEATYLAESGRLLQSRLVLAVVVFMLAMGIGSAVEAACYPDRARPLAVVDAGYLLLCLGSLAFVRRRVGIVATW